MFTNIPPLNEFPPQIAITSYLPDDPAKRKLRFDWHMHQQTVLRDMFFGDEITIVTIGSNYNKKERKYLKDRDYAYVLFGERKQKWEKINYVLKRFYLNAKRADDLTSILFLDDDVVPRTQKDDDVENGLVDCVDLVEHWLDKPDQICGQLAWFACQGSLSDAYYRNEPMIVGTAPTHVTGWAMMVRSDLGVMFTKDLVCEEGKEKYLLDDFPFRVKCGAEGKTVIKHYRAFFKSFQSKDKAEKDSAWFDSQEHRNATNKYQNARMRELFPDFFRRKKAAKIDESKKSAGFFSSKKFFTEGNK